MTLKEQLLKIGEGGILSKIQSRSVTDESGCINWTHSKNSNGYAQFSIGGLKTSRVSRIIWTIVNGQIPVRILISL